MKVEEDTKVMENIEWKVQESVYGGEWKDIGYFPSKSVADLLKIACDDDECDEGEYRVVPA